MTAEHTPPTAERLLMVVTEPDGRETEWTVECVLKATPLAMRRARGEA